MLSYHVRTDALIDLQQRENMPMLLESQKDAMSGYRSFHAPSVKRRYGFISGLFVVSYSFKRWESKRPRVCDFFLVLHGNEFVQDLFGMSEKVDSFGIGET